MLAIMTIENFVYISLFVLFGIGIISAICGIFFKKSTPDPGFEVMYRTTITIAIFKLLSDLLKIWQQ